MVGGRNTRIWLFQNGAVHGLTFSNFHLMIAQRQAGTNSQDQDAPRLAVLPDLRHRSAWHGAWWAWSGFSLAGHPSESSHIPRHPCARGRIVIDLQRIRTTSRQPRCPHAPYFHCLSFFFWSFSRYKSKRPDTTRAHRPAPKDTFLGFCISLGLTVHRPPHHD